MSGPDPMDLVMVTLLFAILFLLLEENEGGAGK